MAYSPWHIVNNSLASGNANTNYDCAQVELLYMKHNAILGEYTTMSHDCVLSIVGYIDMLGT